MRGTLKLSLGIICSSLSQIWRLVAMHRVYFFVSCVEGVEGRVAFHSLLGGHAIPFKEREQSERNGGQVEREREREREINFRSSVRFTYQ